MKFKYHVLSDFRHNIKNSEEDLDPNLWLGKLTREFYRSYNFHKRKSIGIAFTIASVFSISAGLTFWQLFDYGLLMLSAGTIVAGVAAVVVPLLVTTLGYFLLRYDNFIMHMERVKNWKDFDFRSDKASELDQLIGVINLTNEHIYYSSDSEADYYKWATSAERRAGEDREDDVAANEAQQKHEDMKAKEDESAKRKGNGVWINEPGSKHKKSRSRSPSHSETETKDDIPLTPVNKDTQEPVPSPEHSDAQAMANHGLHKEAPSEPTQQEKDDLFMEYYQPRVKEAYNKVNGCFNHVSAREYKREAYIKFGKTWGFYSKWTSHLRNNQTRESFSLTDDEFNKVLKKQIAQHLVNVKPDDIDLTEERARAESLKDNPPENPHLKKRYEYLKELFEMTDTMKAICKEYHELISNPDYIRIRKERRRQEDIKNSQYQRSLGEDHHTTVYSFL